MIGSPSHTFPGEGSARAESGPWRGSPVPRCARPGDDGEERCPDGSSEITRIACKRQHPRLSCNDARRIPLVARTNKMTKLRPEFGHVSQMRRCYLL